MSKWSIDKKQDIIREIESLCEERGIYFEGFVEGKWSCGYTKIKLRCDIHGGWDSTNITNFISLGYGCEKCGREKAILKYRLSDEDAKKYFNRDGKFPTHYFERDTERQTNQQTYSYWKVWCSVCSEDEFSKEGVSPEYFTSSTSHLRAGKVPCRCSKGYRWTEKELLYLIDKASNLKNYNVTNIEYNKNNRLVKSCKLEYTCQEGHLNKTGVSRYIDMERRCNKCRMYGSVRNGYYINRLEDTDYLYLLEFNDYGKIGRTFNPATRIPSFANEAGNKPKTVAIFTGKHRDVYNTEQKFLDTYRKVYVDWTKETVKLNDIQNIYEDLKLEPEIEEI